MGRCHGYGDKLVRMGGNMGHVWGDVMVTVTNW